MQTRTVQKRWTSQFEDSAASPSSVRLSIPRICGPRCDPPINSIVVTFAQLQSFLLACRALHPHAGIHILQKQRAVSFVTLKNSNLLHFRIVVAFNVERYICVLHPLKSHSVCTGKTSRLAIYAWWATMITIHSDEYILIQSCNFQLHHLAVLLRSMALSLWREEVLWRFESGIFLCSPSHWQPNAQG